MYSEPQTPFLEDSFAETKPPVFDIGVGTIQAKLNKRLGPEYVSQRPAPGGGPKLTYVEGWKIIGLANEVFGYNGWCSTVTKIETDFVDMDPETRRYNIGITAIVKVTLKDGTCHEDVGYGTAENMKSKGAALDKVRFVMLCLLLSHCDNLLPQAKKEAVTDGVKRALRNFGNILGLCLYEKSYTQEVIKIKPQPVVCDLHQLCAYIHAITDYACHHLSQSSTSLIYTVGRDLLTFRHLLVAHMTSHRARLPSHSMSPVLLRLKYVQPSPGPVLFEIQLWTLRHLMSLPRTNKGSLVVREREWTPLVYVLARQGNKYRTEIVHLPRTGLVLSTQIGLLHTTPKHQVQTTYTSTTRTTLRSLP
jgi:DNA repair and recombination protein RAD52